MEQDKIIDKESGWDCFRAGQVQAYRIVREIMANYPNGSQMVEIARQEAIKGSTFQWLHQPTSSSALSAVATKGIIRVVSHRT